VKKLWKTPTLQPLIFISYSHKDEQEKEQLLAQLGVLQRAGLIDLWSDDRIAVGADWKAEVSQAIVQAKVAILLITANFLTTEFILDETIPALLQRQKDEGLIIFPIIAKACAWQAVSWLAKMQVRPKQGKPVWRDEGRYADDELAAIATEVASIVGSATAIKALEQTIADLPAHEQSYRERLKARFAEDAPYYVPQAGETTEVTPIKHEPKAPRSARRRGQRALAEYHEWIQAGQELKRVKLNTLREGVDKYPCIILLGDPGSGKTTALEHLAYELADEPDKLPVLLRLSEFESGMTVDEFIAQSWGGSEQAGHWGAVELVANLEGYLEAGKLFFFFDALNEMPREGYKERAQALRQFIDHWSPQGNRFLVTCRVLDYGEELAGLQRVEVQPFEDAQIKEFLQRELPEDWQRLWQALTKTDRPIQNPKSKIQNLIELARNPYMLTMIVDIFIEDGELGQNRAELLSRFSQILMEWARQKCAASEWLEAEVQQEVLSIMAFEMQRRAGAGTVVETGLLKTVMPETVQTHPGWPARPAPPERVLRLAASANIIELPVDRSSVRFYHQLLQEYFSAWQMLRQNPASLAEYWRWPWLEADMPLWERPEDNYDPLPPPPPTGWEETTILAAGLMPENDDQLVRTLLQVNPVLAGRCLYEGQARVDKETHRVVIDRLLSTIARPEVALRIRIAAGEVLGYLGDPRLGQMATIPAGKFLMGEGREQHKLVLPAYRIGKYPLTNAEYARFIEAGGYRAKRWWTEAGWAQRENPWGQNEPWTQPGYWDDGRFNKPNQPVVGVSWYEAVAYCHWLSAETGQPYRLPSEAEWEKSVRGTDGRRYPWGNDFEASRLNVREGAQIVYATTPVGIYPTGVGPYGLSDGAGNVWEWCATKWGKVYPYDVKEDEWRDEYLDGTDVRVLRGGSWFNVTDSARVSARDWYLQVSRFRSLGCRLALVSPI
jgi:formylglycine-generating enzyme required for sulfatase activity